MKRFWAKVNKTDGCWLWTGATRWKGYGAFWDGGRMWVASRFAYELCVGLIPDGLLVLHHCDNPPCVNPDHLFLGTYTDNMRDCVSKDRKATGTDHGSAKLTDDAVVVIRERLEEGETVSAISREYGVDRTTIRRLRDGITWKHVNSQAPQEKNDG